MKIKRIQTEQEWDSLAGEWNQLLAGSISNLPFLRHEYLQAWWQHRGGGEWASAELTILAGYDEKDTLIGIAPFFLSKNHAGKLALFLLGSLEISDFLDLIVSTEHLETFTTALLAYLTGPDAPTWEALELDNFLENSPSLDALETAAAAHGLSFSQERLQPAPLITLPDDFDTLPRISRQPLPPGADPQDAQCAAPLHPHPGGKVGTNADLGAEMDDFFAMMREEPEKDAFLQGAMIEQMKAIAQAAADHGWLDLRFLMVGREKAAGYLNFSYDNRVWVYNSCMASKFANLSPGISLIGLLIQEAIEENNIAFDLMRGDEGYKYELGGVDRWVVKVVVSSSRQ